MLIVYSHSLECSKGRELEVAARRYPRWVGSKILFHLLDFQYHGPQNVPQDNESTCQGRQNQAAVVRDKTMLLVRQASKPVFRTRQYLPLKRRNLKKSIYSKYNLKLTKSKRKSRKSKDKYNSPKICCCEPHKELRHGL